MILKLDEFFSSIGNASKKGAKKKTSRIYLQGRTMFCPCKVSQ